MWNSRRILKELADDDRRKRILTAFWRRGEPASRLLASAHLAKALHFRDETIRKMPPEKKADLLASRIGVPDFDQFLELGLMTYHTHDQSGMLAAFLDRWNVAHVNGAIEGDDYTPPTLDQVREAVDALRGTYDARDVAVYLASAGLLMGSSWSDATWPVVDEMAAQLGS